MVITMRVIALCCLSLLVESAGQLHSVTSPMVIAPSIENVSFRNESVFELHDDIVWEGYLKPATRQTMQFELVSPEVRWIEVFLYVSNNLENYMDLSITSSGNTAGKTDPHLSASVKCVHLLDVCQQQRMYQYCEPPGINKSSSFSNRLALRVQSNLIFDASTLDTKWTIRIGNKLPDLTNNALVRLEVHQYTTNYIAIVAPVFVVVVFCVLAAAAYFVAWVQERRSDHSSARAEVHDVAHQIREAAIQLRANIILKYSAIRGTNPTTGDVEMDERNSDTASQSDDEEMCCRICRSTAPREDLFSPCNCRGSVKYVHKTCLEKWRQKTTSATNKKQCSECKGHFKITVTQTKKRYLYVVSATKKILILLLTAAVLELTIVSVGFLFKSAAGILTNNFENTLWSIDAYHHFVGSVLLVTVFVHHHHLDGFLSEFISIRVLRVFLIILSTLLEVVLGYIVALVRWTFSSSVWNWQISFVTGVTVMLVYRGVVHDVLIQQYMKWRDRHTVEQVMEPSSDDVESGEQLSEVSNEIVVEDFSENDEMIPTTAVTINST